MESSTIPAGFMSAGESTFASPPTTEPPKKKPATRTYIVLEHVESNDNTESGSFYIVAGIADALTDKAAIDAAVPAEKAGTFVAIPKRSFNPRKALSSSTTTTAPDGTEETVVRRTWA